MSDSPYPVLALPTRSAPSASNARVLPRRAGTFTVQRPGERGWRGLNLSAGGMLCTAPEPVWPGNTVDLEIELDASRRLAVRGEVAELVPVGGHIAMRLRFAGLQPQARQAIMQWVAQCPPRGPNASS